MCYPHTHTLHTPHLHTHTPHNSHPHTHTVLLIGPYGTASAEFMTFPVKRGAFELVVHFSSDQLADIEDTEGVQWNNQWLNTTDLYFGCNNLCEEFLQQLHENVVKS